MSRAWVWLQLLIGWLPIWALFTTLIATAHPDVRPLDAALSSLRMMLAAAVLGLVVHRLTAKLPWPHPFRLRFLALHLLGAIAFAACWFVLNSVIESVVRLQTVIVIGGAGLGPFLILGVWLYVMVAGIAYAHRGAQRSAQVEALAARTQLAALRAQLNPHFLFNALHTVVQLIPLDPRGAVRAAEQLAALLRTVVEEQRDLVPLADERDFVRRYLELESIRFGDRLRVRTDIPDALMAAAVPSFALQTLVENAVRHGAAPRVEPTTLEIRAREVAGGLELCVGDDGAGASPGLADASTGSGLRRLRERLAWLYGDRAKLHVEGRAGAGFTARLLLPLAPGERVSPLAAEA